MDERNQPPEKSADFDTDETRVPSGNPYVTPATLAYKEKLSPAERRVVEFYWKYRDVTPTFWNIASRYALAWSLRCGILGALIVVLQLIYWTVAPPVIPWRYSSTFPAIVFISGLTLGSILRDLGMIRQTIRFWPLTSRLMDWQQVESMLE